uniref:RWD domain-containing protein n=1 Tax=Clastoptera arizonana TaxID=38151 RepID=A0A1B6BXR7_9HEMI
MGLVEDELQDVRKLCEHLIIGSKLVSCVQTMVRVEIKRTSFKYIIVCIQFPAEYPSVPILIELKSKTLSEKLLYKLTGICEQEAKKYLGKPQILKVLKFIRTFIDENPLSCCFDEISDVRKDLNNDKDELKLRQKNSIISLRLHQGKYHLKTKIKVPDDYPTSSVSLEDVETNFPPLFERHFKAQAIETARQCVEPPLGKKTIRPIFPTSCFT